MPPASSISKISLIGNSATYSRTNALYRTRALICHASKAACVISLATTESRGRDVEGIPHADPLLPRTHPTNLSRDHPNAPRLSKAYCDLGIYRYTAGYLYSTYLRNIKSPTLRTEGHQRSCVTAGGSRLFAAGWGGVIRRPEAEKIRANDERAVFQGLSA